MKRLTLIRHAKSSWVNSSQTDFERPLSGRGLSDAQKIGAHLRTLSFSPVDCIVTSPALRAITTASFIAHALSFKREYITEEPRIYEASLACLYAVVRAFENSDRHVLMVGHNPGFEQLAQDLHPQFVGDGAKYPTCGVAHMELAIEQWPEISEGCAAKCEFIYPKVL